MSGSQSERVEALRQLLGYPLVQKDPQGSRFWFLRPGADQEEAEDTCPIAVGFYTELEHLGKQEIKAFVASEDQQREIYGHYADRVIPEQPVMYLLLPEGARVGHITLVLPTEGGLRQRHVDPLPWDSSEVMGRLSRLLWGEMPIPQKALAAIPLVEWVFFKAAKTASELAQLLAEVTRRMEQAIPSVYEAEGSDDYLHQLFDSFWKELLPTLKLSSLDEKDYGFSDIYAQTIAYGLFTARVFSHVKDPKADFNRQQVWEKLPETNPFLRRLFRDISERSPEELGSDLLDSIAEVFGILRAAKMDTILSDFRRKLNREDIAIRFYEDFLAAYKSDMREKRGVYYTPEPVVSYRMRSVDILLKEKFDKPLGLADPEVMILDPACGTGTFLLWIFQEIYRKFQENPEALTEGLADPSWSGYVKERLLPRIFGFELLMDPYAICHLKLGLFLEETGYQFDSGRRLGIYLTNTLDEAIQKSESLFEEFIAEESDQAAEIKRDKPIMAVIGNPPYSGHSANKGPWIDKLLRDDYHNIDGQPLGEKNPKWLQDDYVEFVRFGQWRIQQTGYGILAFVTNYGYLDNPTFRGMRQSLQGTFDWIRVLDLHGNSKKKEKAPDGSKDENVFDIQQGVSICLMVKDNPEYVSLIREQGG